MIEQKFNYIHANTTYPSLQTRGIKVKLSCLPTALKHVMRVMHNG